MANINVTPEQVAELGAECKRQAEAITQLAGVVDSKVAGTQWDSPAANKFKDDWGQHFQALKSLRESLDSLGQAANAMARNYEEADAAYGRG